MESMGIHDVIIVGLPLLMILGGILMNRSDAKDLRSEMKDLRQEAIGRHSEVLARFNVLEADMRQFYHLAGHVGSAHGLD